MSSTVLAITGPTGVGKTAVAMAVAARTPAGIVSADSRQVYRGLDIGTAKPSAAERARVPHEGIDLVGAHERYSAGQFARDAAGWIGAFASAGRMPVVVGGTGFYLRALFDGLFAEPALDPERRAALRAALATLGGHDLARWAARLDPGFRGGGRQRAQRAIEIALLTGRNLAMLQRESPPPARRYAPWYVVLELPRERLDERLAARTTAMLAGGWIEETARLRATGVPDDAPGLSGVGYPEILAFLAGTLSREALAPAIIAATRRYARRQATWFRHQLRGRVLRLDASGPPAVLAEAVLAGYRASRSPDTPVPRSPAS